MLPAVAVSVTERYLCRVEIQHVARLTGERQRLQKTPSSDDDSARQR